MSHRATFFGRTSLLLFIGYDFEKKTNNKRKEKRKKELLQLLIKDLEILLKTLMLNIDIKS